MSSSVPDLPQEFNRWGTLTFQLPDVFEDLRAYLQLAFEFLNQVAELLLTVLEVARAYTVAYIDPAMEIFDLFIEEILGFLDDLDQIGLYLAGDWELAANGPYEDLRGGFAKYESRMIARLTDSADPTRPDVTSKTIVFGAFFYQSVDISALESLLDYIMNLATFFRVSAPQGNALQTPVIEGVEYGVEAADAFNGRSLADSFSLDPNPPNVARVEWSLRTASARNPLNPYPSLPPKGFIVTVGVFKDGLPLAFTRVQRDTKGAKSKSGDDEDVQIQEQGFARNFLVGSPIVLYGGADHLELNPEWGWNENTNNKKPVAGSTRVFGQLNPAANAVIPLEELKKGDTYFLQRSFFLPAVETGFQWPTETFTYEIPADKLPLDARPVIDGNGKITLEEAGTAKTYYVRVATVSERVVGSTASSSVFKYNLEDAISIGGANILVPLKTRVSDKGEGIQVRGNIGPWSEPIPLVYPRETTAKYLEAIQTALIVLVLSRSELPTLAELRAEALAELAFIGLGGGGDPVENLEESKENIPDFARTETGLEPFADLLREIYPDPKKIWEQQIPAQKFRSDLYDRTLRVAESIYKRASVDTGFEATIVSVSEKLRTITWKEILEQYNDENVASIARLLVVDPKSKGEIKNSTIRGSLQEEEDEGGVASTPWSLGIREVHMNTLMWWSRQVVLARQPHFLEVTSDPQDSPLGRWEEAIGRDIDIVMHELPTRAEQRLAQSQARRDGKVKPDKATKSAVKAAKTVGEVFTEGSADRSPVFYINKPALEALAVEKSLKSLQNPKQKPPERGAVVFIRSLFGGVDGNVVYNQAKQVLGAATAAMNRPARDGQWLVVRLGQVLPPLDDVMNVFSNWAEAVKKAIDSIASVFDDYIQFIRDRILETQELIRRINDIIAKIVIFAMPKSAGLLLLSPGTDGLLSDFISAQDKPSDSPLAYGGGIVVVGVGGPSFLLELFKSDDKKPEESTLPDASGPGPAIEPVPPEDLIPPTPPGGPPEVL